MSLIRDPADWAREQGWVSALRARRAAERLRILADAIDGTLGAEDSADVGWAESLRDVANYLSPRKARGS